MESLGGHAADEAPFSIPEGGLVRFELDVYPGPLAAFGLGGSRRLGELALRRTIEGDYLSEARLLRDESFHVFWEFPDSSAELGSSVEFQVEVIAVPGVRLLSPAEGEAVYKTHCAPCHGSDLEGSAILGADALIGGRGSLATAKPIKTVESYWPVGLGADVTILDRSLPRLRELDDIWGGRVHTVYSTRHEIDRLVADADLVVGAVLVAGAAAPKLVTAQNVKAMHAGAVMVDISIDQGGCFETSRPTTHADPTYVVDGVVHYCVTNMPGAVPRTSTFALTNATLPFVKALANLGWREALIQDPHLANGLNVHAGHVNHEAVARDLGYEYLSADEVLKAA